ncbi:MAG: class I SAM-dependent methyltransferase [Actinomycetota bacterium]|nr:class I SAM-dependent methyltransferase [Actinomycetota bacterium]
MSIEHVESDYYTFMGFDPDNARAVLSHYLQFFDQGPVLELACGPGIFLDLLTDRGIACRGVDIDGGMVTQARSKGHDVALADAVEHLRTLPDSSLHGLFAAHFVEHLPSEEAQALYVEAARVLVPGGVFVAVVPNAACLSVLTFDFWRDPTHVRFYDPVALQFFARQAGLVVTSSGGNPANHAGAPPDLHPQAISTGSDLAGNVNHIVSSALATFQGLGSKRGQSGAAEAMGEVVAQLGHLIAVLNRELLTLGHETARLREANVALLSRLYPPNEVYVVAGRLPAAAAAERSGPAAAPGDAS